MGSDESVLFHGRQEECEDMHSTTMLLSRDVFGFLHGTYAVGLSEAPGTCEWLPKTFRKFVETTGRELTFFYHEIV